MITKKTLSFICVVSFLGVGSIVYYVPVRQYIASKRLYSLLKKNDQVDKADVHIITSGKDFKSSRGGFFFELKVDGSKLVYTYDYSFTENNWLITYDDKGTNVVLVDQHIIFDKEEGKGI